MKKVKEIKNFLEIEELSKLEQSAIQGGSAQGKQKQKQKGSGDNDAGGPTQ